MNKLKKLLEALFNIGAYEKGTSKLKEVDGKMGSKTRATIKKALSMGYKVDINKGTISKSSNTLSSSGRSSTPWVEVPPEIAYVEESGMYNPVLGERAMGGGYVLPEVVATYEPNQRVNQLRRTNNERTRKQARVDREASKKMASIEGNIDFATARGQNTLNVTEEEREVTPPVGWNSPAQFLALAAVNGILGRSVTYRIPEEHRRVLSDLNQWILDNWDKAILHNLQIAQQTYLGTLERHQAATGAEREKLAKELESNLASILHIKDLYEEIRKAGGLYEWIITHPYLKMVIGANMRLYKDSNLRRFPESTPINYANFNSPNYVSYAQDTPLGQVENIYGNNVQSFVYDPGTNRIITRMSDVYDFNPYGSSSEDSEVKQLRTAAGNSKVLKGGRTSFADTLTSIPVNEREGSQRYLETEEFGSSANEDTEFRRKLLNLGIEYFKNH